MALEGIRNYLGEAVEEDVGRSSDVRFNGLLRDYLFQDGKAYNLEFADETFTAAGVSVTLRSLRFVGLDSATKLNILQPIAPQTLQNKIGWERLSLELNVELTMVDLENVFDLDDAQPETLTLSLGIEDVELDFAILVAMDEALLGNFELGSLLKTQEIVPCLLKKVEALQLTQMAISVGKVTVPTIGGFLSEEATEKISESARFVFETYQKELVEALPVIVDESLRVLLNGAVVDYQDRDDIVCTSFDTSGTGFVDFRDLFLSEEMSRKLGGSGQSPYGDLLRGLLDIVNKNVLKTDEDGKPTINELLIAPLTLSQSGENGTLRYSGDLLDSGTRIDIGGLQANIELKAFNARIQGIDTLGEPLSILDPLEYLPYILNNTASFGVGGRPLRFAVTVSIFVTNDDDLQLRNEIDISVDLSSATIVLEALLKVTEGSFLGFPLRDIQNLQCWLAAFPAPSLDSRGVRLPDSSPSAGITNLAISLARLNLNITCISCSSPQMEELATLLSTQTAITDLNRVGNNLLDSAAQLLGGEFFQMQIDRMLNDAPRHCPHRGEYDANAAPPQYETFESPDRKDDSITFLITLAIVAVCLIVSAVIVINAVKCIVGRRNRRWVRTLPNDKVMLLHRLQTEERAKEGDLNRATKSMFCAHEIPLYVRYFIPVVILVNIGFFLSGHLSLGATVNIKAQLAGETITVEKFFEFSMAQSTLDIWRAGGKELAILILIFSGVWPYTKQVLTLVLWFAPPSVVSVSKRGSIFLWLDALAKWSMVDIFVLIVSVAAFRVSIQSPDVDFLPDGFYSVDLLVVPLWGLYANMIAQLISQVSSHFVIHYHRRIVHVASENYGETHGLERIEAGLTEEERNQSHNSQSIDTSEDRKEILRAHAFARPHRGEKDRLILRSGNGSMMVAASIIVSVLVVVGSALPSFSLEVLGVMGVAIESAQEFKQAITKHSVFTIVKLLFEEASFLGTVKDYIGLGSLSILLILTVVIVPIAQAICLLRQWLSPITHKQRRRLSICIESLQAWQYVEVYLIALIVSAWQLGPVSEFMINSYCDGLSGTFALLAYYGILDPMDAQCFRVQAGIEDATYIMVAAAIILALMTTFVTKAVKQYERDNSTVAEILGEVPKLSGVVDYNDLEVDAARRSITPPPVLFSDSFRWFLCREDSHVPQRALLGLDEEAKLGVDGSFADAARAGELEVEQGVDQLVVGVVVGVGVGDFDSVMTPDDESCDLPRMHVDEHLYARNL